MPAAKRFRGMYKGARIKRDLLKETDRRRGRARFFSSSTSRAIFFSFFFFFFFPSVPLSLRLFYRLRNRRDLNLKICF
ncbi:hypothetical protein PUN28_004458 [Cardiocondyla obscurior]|uniref:Uncharacterized protein n=1 Tax=Cardiocondyla obscurior TaxID=286306 RepID=A0AAW2GAV0_9HYME